MLERTMSGQVDAAEDTEHMSAWWWLWLPLLCFLVLVVLKQAFPATNRIWIVSEQGLLEFSQVVIPLISSVVALRMLVMPRLRRTRLLWLWVGLAALGSFYLAGEEASWGQHYAGWSTPDYWKSINDQGETNLHNTSSWFDQKPRMLLEIGVLVGGILVPLLALRRPAIRRSRLAIILPPLICLPSAALAEFAYMWERTTDLLNGNAYLFERASEVQEFYFYVFILLYLIVLRRRLRA